MFYSTRSFGSSVEWIDCISGHNLCFKVKESEQRMRSQSNARKLMSELMIGDIEKALVENCSGGERKRLVIAQDLTAIDKPNLLCIDEPTSGLDSNAADIVSKYLSINV